MEGLRQPHCMNCGGDVRTVDEHTLKCNYCGSVFENHSFQKKSVSLQEFLDRAKLEYVKNQRRNLYDAVCFLGFDVRGQW